MKTQKKYIICGILSGLLLICMPALAQNGKATATIDSANILIGDHVHLQLQYSAPSKATVHWPVLRDTLSSHIEIISKQATDTVKNGDPKTITLAQTLTITCFDSGSFAIPPISFSYTLPGDTTTYTNLTAPLMLNVNTMAVDTTQAIKDIKEPLKAPLTLMEMLPWIGGGILVLALIALIVYVIIRRKKKKPIFGAFRKPALPAHLEALVALEKLRQEHLWQQGHFKEYHSRLSDILRIYMEKRWNIPAPEMITPDVLNAVSRQESLTPELQNRLKNALELSDRVKFAKFQPLPDEHDQCMRDAVLFVETTADKTTEAPEKTGTPDDFISEQLKNPDKEGSL